MGINAQSLLDLARELYNDKRDDEKYRRASSSRAYYFAFHTCKQIAEKLPLVAYPDRVKPGSHQIVIDRMMKCPVDGEYENTGKLLRTVGRMLQFACDERVKADYSLAMDFPVLTANQQLIRVTEILTKLKSANLV